MPGMNTDSGYSGGPFQLPQYLRNGPSLDEQVTVGKLQNQNEVFRRLRLREGPGIRIISAPDGYIIELLNPYQQASTVSAWPFKVYNASVGTNFKVRVNSGDGYVGTIRNQIARINGTPISTPAPPATAPLLTTGGTGFIYIQVYLNADGTINTSGGGGSGVDILWSATEPIPLDPSSPPTYTTQVIAQNTVNGSTQTVDNVTNYGFTNFNLCNADGGFY